MASGTKVNRLSSIERKARSVFGSAGQRQHSQKSCNRSPASWRSSTVFTALWQAYCLPMALVGGRTVFVPCVS